MNSTAKKTPHPWIESAKFESMGQAELLRAILARVKEAVAQQTLHGGKLVKVVFDLDSTVFNVQPRTLRIVKEFGRTPEAKVFPKLFLDWCASLDSHQLAYTLEDSARQNGFPVDHAQAKDFIKAAAKFWRKRFFSHEYVLQDHPAPGAQDFVHAVVDAGARAIYLTGRDLPGMGKGTVSLLQHWGFPMGAEQSRLIMKPYFGLDDSEFKDSALNGLRNHAEAVAFFDNEPANFAVFEKNFPEAFLVFFHSNCSGKPAGPVNKIYKIESFLFH